MNEAHIIDCEEALHRLLDFLNAELQGESLQELERHLERCRSCFSRFEFEKRLKAHVAELGREPVPSELHHRIRKVLAGFKG
jgi:anti-sigma factor (TIGR02949 family)